MATYSNRIKELRTARGWSQLQLAEKLDISNVAVSQYERGVRKPDINVLTAMCDIFNVSSDYLLGYDDVTVRYLTEEDLKKLDNGRQDGQSDGYYVYGDAARMAQEYFDDPMTRTLFDARQGASAEDVQMAIDLLNRLKRTNPDG